MRALSTEWTKRCKTEEQKQKLESLLRNSTISLGLLREIVRERIKSLERSERNVQAYENPNWASMQAHTNGMVAAYNSIDQLLSFTDKE